MPATDLALPSPLDTPEFRAAWAEWLAYRKERRLAGYKPIGLAKLLNRLAAMGAAGAVAALEHSMSQNYQGVWEPKSAGTVRAAGGDRALEVIRYARES